MLLIPAHIMIIPDIERWYLPVGACKWLCRIPPYVVVHVIVITLFTQTLPEIEFSSFVRVPNIGPCLQRSCDTDTIIVDLITATNPVLC